MAQYKNHKTPVEILCSIHGSFWQRPVHHVGGAGCPQCAGRGVDWVERFKTMHGDTYDYSNVVYKAYKTPVVIVCREHGVFMQTPDNHYRGRQGCPKCKGAKIRTAKQTKIVDFINRAMLVHKGRYTYGTAQFENQLTGVVSINCLLYTSPSPRDGLLSRMPSSA